jgi:hypothetical protein
VARTLCKRHLERDIIPSKKERAKKITINPETLACNDEKSILINILIKNTIFEDK